MHNPLDSPNSFFFLEHSANWTLHNTNSNVFQCKTTRRKHTYIFTFNHLHPVPLYDNPSMTFNDIKQF